MASKSIKGITIELDGNTTKLVDSLKDVEKKSNAVNSELRQVNKLIKFNPNNTETLAQKQKLLKDQVQATSDKLKTLKDAQKQVNEQFKNGEISEEAYRGFKREVVETESKLKHYKSTLKEVNKAHLESTLGLDKVKAGWKKTADGFKTAGENLTKAGKTMSATVTAPLVGLGLASFNMAADLEDAFGATEQIFRDSAGVMKEWADDIPSYYGIAEGEALTYANTMGAMLKNIGGLSEAEAAKQAQILTELAGDLSAMFGGSTEEAINALTGALKGNTTMLDNYGMGVNDATIKQKAFEMGLYSGKGAMDLQTKQAATLALIMEQTADAQGQAGREAEGASGSMKALMTELKNLSTEIGEVLLPIITPLIQKVNEWIGKFAELDEGTKQMIVIVGMLVAAIGPLLMMLDAMSTGISLLMGPFGLVVAAIAAVIAIGVELYKNWDTIKVKAGEIASVVSIKFESIRQSITDKINAAKTAVGNAIEKMKSFFNFTWSLPKIKLPRFSISGKFSLNPPSVPKFGIEWYKKGGILTKPTAFGMNGNNLMVGGEAGKEAVLPLNEKNLAMIGAGIAKALGGQQQTPQKAGDIVINIDGAEFMRIINPHFESQGGENYRMTKRGLAW